MWEGAVIDHARLPNSLLLSILELNHGGVKTILVKLGTGEQVIDVQIGSADCEPLVFIGVQPLRMNN